MSNLGAQSLYLSNDHTRKEENSARKPDPATKKTEEAEKAAKRTRQNSQGQNSALGASI